MTEKLFYQDSYTRDFQAEVIDCIKDGEYFYVVLNRTAFFPEGGGQYADTGYLNDVEVLDVQESEGGCAAHSPGPGSRPAHSSWPGR